MQARERAPIYTTAVLAGPVCGILGLDWPDVLARAGIVATQRNDRAFLVAADAYLRIWNAMADLSAQQDMSRLLGLRMAGGPAIPILFALSTAPDFETGISRMAAFKSLFGPMQFIVSRTPTEFSVRVAADAPTALLPGSFSSPQIIYLHAQANALARHAMRPLRVALPLPHEERVRLAEVFGQVPVHGDATLTYASADARIPFVSDNPDLWHATEADLQSQAMIQSNGLPLSDRVRATMLEAFSITEPTVAHVCGRLRLSRSTLLRRLDAEGRSFQSLLDETRKDLAIRYLIKSDLNNQQIAHLVGYRDPNAFQRAFRKWTGMTPQALRATRVH
ncbi:helix-turn-helix transcriptional regulator [Roseicitreum antarcticum]|uniref:AraC-type DNA-binding protein n=1 Tax=Roseicitreum antarcticum TaxID=564137 RepID=A0A1H2ZNQ9_9RHOB|nr:AraC family transcriptional regulator [Roseicitreum antarcticum]SDX19053.1 AraC-type DNA-binding protein [Roseicitreum antarcticum]